MARDLGPIKSKKQRQAEARQNTMDAIGRLQAGQASGPRLPGDFSGVPKLDPQNIPMLPLIEADPQGKVDAAIADTGSLQGLVDKRVGPVVKAGAPKRFNPATGNMDLPVDEGIVGDEIPDTEFEFTNELDAQEEGITAELEAQKQQNVKLEPETLVGTAEEVIAKEELKSITDSEQYAKRFDYKPSELNRDRDALDVQNDIETLVNRGDLMNDQLTPMMLGVLTEDTEVGDKVRRVLSETAAYDPETGALSPKVGRAVMLAQALIGNELLNKENELKVQRKKIGGNYDAAESTEDAPIAADMVRNQLGIKVLDIIGENVNRLSDEVSVNYGGAGAAADSDAVAALSAIFTQAINADGHYVKVPVQETGELIPALSETGALWARGNQNLLIDMGFLGEIDTSSAPTMGGASLPGRGREKGFSRVGDRSRKTYMDKNTAKQDRAKSLLGALPHKVIQERFVMAKMMVDSLISFDGRAIRILGATDTSPDGRVLEYSTREFAGTLGLDKKKWRKAYDNAIKTMGESAAVDQANMVMRQEARKLLKITQHGIQKSGKAFYNKIFDADTVGRLFFRNTVLNTQDSKSLARMFVGNAVDVVINPNRDRDSQIFKNFMYITGRNLLDPDRDLEGRETEDMGWSAVMQASRQAFNSPRYDEWVKKGNMLKKMLAAIALDPQSNLDGFTVNDPELAELLKEFKKKGEWGYKYQSYIDVANYDTALKENKSFKAKAQTQHDGKQNGIAIQAMQMGNLDILSRVGMIFKDPENVLPWGDVRALFGQKLNEGIKYAVKSGGMTDDKLMFWNSIFVGSDSKFANMSPAQQREILKLLSKQPLMEISYGRYFLFNEETATEFIGDTELTGNLLSTEGYQGGRYTEAEMINDLNLIIAGTVQSTLNFKHQALFKKAGLLSAMLGTTLSIQGPAGNMIYMGSTEMYRTGQTLDVDTGVEILSLDVFKPRVTGSAPMQSRGLRMKEGRWVIEKASRFGQEVANQLPVLPIQQIDAAVMIESINEVNRDVGYGSTSGYDMKPPAFVIPIHDAIITDASSVNKYYEAMNRNFVKVNKQYSLTNAVAKGLIDTKNFAFKRINDSEQYTMDYESIYRALHEELVMLDTRKREGVEKVVDMDGVIAERKASLSDINEAILKIATTGTGGYWNPDGTGSLSGEKIKQLINAIFKRERINSKLLELHKDVTSQRQKAFKELAPEPAQYG